MTTGHLPQNWIPKLCVLLSVSGWNTGTFPHQVVRLFTAWADAEGGTATWNPLNTTDHITSNAKGSWQGADYNSAHVANYVTPFAGIVATADTFLAGPYDGLVKAIRTAGESGVTAEELVKNYSAEISTWGTSPKLMLSVLANIK